MGGASDDQLVSVKLQVSPPTVRLSHDHGEEPDGPVGVAEPGAVEAEQDGGGGDLQRPLADLHTGRRDRGPWGTRGTRSIKLTGKKLH